MPIFKAISDVEIWWQNEGHWIGLSGKSRNFVWPSQQRFMRLNVNFTTAAILEKSQPLIKLSFPQKVFLERVYTLPLVILSRVVFTILPSFQRAICMRFKSFSSRTTLIENNFVVILVVIQDLGILACSHVCKLQKRTEVFWKSFAFWPSLFSHNFWLSLFCHLYVCL